MSNDKVRWTGKNVEENVFSTINFSKCDNFLANSSSNLNNVSKYSVVCISSSARTGSCKCKTKRTYSTKCPLSPLRKLQKYTNSNIFLTLAVIFILQISFLNCTAYAISISNSIEQNERAFDKQLNLESSQNNGHFTHTWAVHIPQGDSGLAEKVALDHGFVNLGKIFDDHYHFAHHKVAKRSVDPSDHHQKRLDGDVRVSWSQQQKAKSRQKRDYKSMRPSRMSTRMTSLAESINLIDPKWEQMWYLNRGGGLDMNVIPAWQQGITGKGVVVTILDDGLEYTHPDIEHNYDENASYDVNSHDPDPTPQYDMTDSNRHGTRCAGEVAATANNTFCAVGIAYDAKVGGVRMLDGDVTDAVEARSLSLNPQHIDIYSASWGPDDDGVTVDGPGELATRAFIEGVTKGRSGKGSIFIWASGNGGQLLDNCNCDGYTNSIWTLSISSATEEGNVPWYSEKCSSTLATTYSSGGQNEKKIVTTDLHHSCTSSHTGTSASAPLAAGIAALALEANRNLTWRDLQHIVVRTANPANLQDRSWSKNGVGRRVSHSFGYGLMDAAAMVKAAKTWKQVPEQQKCEINAPHLDKKIPPKNYITLQLTVKHCKSLNYLEHVQAKITLTSQRRGDLQINLISPAGTKVTLLTHRIHDVSRSGFNQWPFMSVHTWGESPHGKWLLEIYNNGQYMAQITQWEIIFRGTEVPAQPDDPVHISLESFDDNSVDNTETSNQWNNMPHIDSQFTNDVTNTACHQITVNQRCIECNQPAYLYNSRCYLTCPNGTFAPIEAPMRDIEDLEEDSLDPLFLTAKKRSIIELRRTCLPCHKSCMKCKGGNANDCSLCAPGSQLREIANEGSFCFGFSERSSGNNKFEDFKDKHINYYSSFFLVIVPGILVLTGITVLVVYRKYLYGNSGERAGIGSYTYTQVAADSLTDERHPFNLEEGIDEIDEEEENEDNDDEIVIYTDTKK